MRNILLIAEEWLRLVRSQKSFRILAGLSMLLGLLLAAVEISPEEVKVLWSFRIPLGGTAESPVLANEIVYGILSFLITLLPLITAFVAVFTTGGVVPEMIRKGRLEVLLARPVRRYQVVLGAYVGGLVFTALIAGILLLATWVGLAVRGRFIGPEYFLNLPVIVAQYALISVITVWIGFTLRSGGAAIVVTLLLWFLGKMVSGAYAIMVASKEMTMDKELEGFQSFLAGPAGKVVAAAWWILPKPGEFAVLTNQILDACLEDGLTRRLLSRAKQSAELAAATPPLADVAFSSGALIVFLLALTSWSLSRRDL